jgi:pimeloyl-ACP methyl ester carboxylesterase
MSRYRLFAVLAAACLLNILAVSVRAQNIILLAVSGQAQTVGQYTTTDCPDEFAELPVTLECGEVTAPLYHEDPARGTIQLAVFRLRAAGDAPAADPLVMLQGGPGGSVNTLVTVAASGSLQDLLNDRDLVFIEQRGNLYSKPALVCPTYTRVYAEALQSTDLGALAAAEAEAVERCTAEFSAAGVDLAAFDSYENARDIPLVVLDGLGYDAYNLYGVSYGSLLAQHVMEVAPRGLRSVILDAVAPRGVNPNEQSINYGWRALNLLLQACEADETCSSQHPNLTAELFSLIERLNESPADITIVDTATGEEFTIKLNGSRLAVALFNSLYDTSGLRRIPAEIFASAAQDDFEWASATLSSLLSSSFSVGMNFAVNCAEHDYAASEQTVDPDVPAVFAQALQQEQADQAASCRLIDVPPLPDEARTLADAPIPTLVMSGEFDPITPPDYGELVAQALPNAKHVVFPGTAHGAIYGACPQSIARAFLQDPEAELDTSCVQEMGLTFLKTVRFVEYQLDGVVFLGPEGWLEIDSGAYADFETGSILVVRVIEGRSLQAELDALLGEAQGALEEGTAEIVVQRQARLGSFEWELLRIDSARNNISLIVAGAESDSQTYLVQLQTSPDQADQLAEDVLIPLLNSLRAA